MLVRTDQSFESQHCTFRDLYAQSSFSWETSIYTSSHLLHLLFCCTETLLCHTTTWTPSPNRGEGLKGRDIQRKITLQQLHWLDLRKKVTYKWKLSHSLRMEGQGMCNPQSIRSIKCGWLFNTKQHYSLLLKLWRKWGLFYKTSKNNPVNNPVLQQRVLTAARFMSLKQQHRLFRKILQNWAEPIKSYILLCVSSLCLLRHGSTKCLIKPICIIFTMSLGTF